MARRKRITLQQIRQSLEDQLIAMGADVPLYQSQIDSYMEFAALERKALADLKKNGRTIQAISASGKEYDKENPAHKQAKDYSAQQLNILKALGLNAGNCRKPDENDGDL